MLKHRLLALILLSLLLACARGGKVLSQDEEKFYRDMQQAQEQLKTVQGFVNSTKISKARYVIKLDEIRPVTQKMLARYQSSAFAERESYRALLRSYENYLMARKMWEDEKGLALVNERMAEGNNWLRKAEGFIAQEMKSTPEEAK